jgi:hypothetical protein
MFQHYCVINIKKKNQDKKNIQGDSGEGLNIFAGERIGHCGGGKKKDNLNTRTILNAYRDTAV